MLENRDPLDSMSSLLFGGVGSNPAHDFENVFFGLYTGMKEDLRIGMEMFFNVFLGLFGGRFHR